MKKHKFIVLALTILLLFAAVSCDPEIKADPLDDQKQAIPAENVDMSKAQAIDEGQKESLETSLDNAVEQFSKGIIAKAMASEKGMTFGKVLNEYFGYEPSTSEPVGAGTTVKAFESLKGSVSVKAKKVVYYGEYYDTDFKETTTGEVSVSNIAATATLSESKIEVVVNGTIAAKPFAVTLKYTIDDDGETGEPEFTDGDEESKSTFGMIAGMITAIRNNTGTITGVSGLTIEANGVEMTANIPVTDYAKGTVQLTASIEGKASVKKTSATGALIKVDTLKVSASIDQVVNLDATIKGLSVNTNVDDAGGLEFSGISISEVSLSGAFLPLRDNIRFKANVEGFEIFSTGTIAIDSVDASIMGYGVISVAANIDNFSIDLRYPDSSLEFTFGAAASIGNQTIGVRGGIFGSIRNFDFDATLLNGKPVTAKSLVDFFLEYINSISPSAAL